MTNRTKLIYCDNQSTTRMDPEVIAIMQDVMSTEYGNPSSQHKIGYQSSDVVENARQQIADVINCDKSEIIFTSGATESNNIAIQGILNFYKETKNHIITSAIEHPCILNACKHMERSGFDVTYIKPKSTGLIDVKDIEDAITDKTILVSIHGTNHEIGAIQELKKIGSMCRSKQVFFHTDCAQAFGKILLDVKDMNIDLLSISGHKIYGPKGIGALYVGKNPRVKLKPIMFGGGQERGIRSGTVPTFLIAGLGMAAKVAMRDYEKNFNHISKLSHKMQKAFAELPEVYLNCDPKNHYVGCLNFGFKYIEGESFMAAMPDIMVSTGSACSSTKLEPSYIIRALGVADVLAHSSVRFGIGKFNTEEEIDIVIDKVKAVVKRLRDASPLWEMAQEGINIETIEWKGHH